MEHYHGYSFPSPLPTITPYETEIFCETEDMILFYLLLKQNALTDLLLIVVFLILFNCTWSYIDCIVMYVKPHVCCDYPTMNKDSYYYY